MSCSQALGREVDALSRQLEVAQQGMEVNRQAARSEALREREVSDISYMGEALRDKGERSWAPLNMHIMHALMLPASAGICCP